MSLVATMCFSPEYLSPHGGKDRVVCCACGAQMSPCQAFQKPGLNHRKAGRGGREGAVGSGDSVSQEAGKEMRVLLRASTTKQGEWGIQPEGRFSGASLS